MDKMSETYHSPSWHLDLKDNEIRNLRTRVAELESGIKTALAEIEGGCYADAHGTLSSL